MTRKQQRLAFVCVAVGIASLAAVLMLTALQGTVVYFRNPSELVKGAAEVGERIRVGGLVVDGSVERGQELRVSFAVSDADAQTRVRFQGQLPDLFREGQGIIAEGIYEQDGSVTALEVLAKHDENYIPKEIAQSLKDQGVWQGNE